MKHGNITHFWKKKAALFCYVLVRAFEKNCRHHSNLWKICATLRWPPHLQFAFYATEESTTFNSIPISIPVADIINTIPIAILHKLGSCRILSYADNIILHILMVLTSTRPNMAQL